ncbi:addiction module protein [Haloferula rosea]|uniref:Addiction module protein n=2 Tax=Haloferula rosea TaxID=490093 RepID=A0A934VF19_9BACT|nr:addiction module protein [Haloferula rosea]
MRLPKVEKLRLMEALWSDLTSIGDGFESPSWHEAALHETEGRYKSGEEQRVDWAEAKRRLRSHS